MTVHSEERVVNVTQNELFRDEFSLQEDELTKEQVAVFAKVSVKSVDNWKREGKLTFTEARRRIGENVRVRPIFSKDEVLAFLNREVITGKVEKESEGALVTQDNKQLFEVLGAMFNQINANITASRKRGLCDLTGKLNLSIEELADVSGIAKSRIDTAIKIAEESKTLSRYAGKQGKIVYRCDDLDLIIESIPPIEIVRRLPPMKKSI